MFEYLVSLGTLEIGFEFLAEAPANSLIDHLFSEIPPWTQTILQGVLALAALAALWILRRQSKPRKIRDDESHHPQSVLVVSSDGRVSQLRRAGIIIVQRGPGTKVRKNQGSNHPKKGLRHRKASSS